MGFVVQNIHAYFSYPCYTQAAYVITEVGLLQKKRSGLMDKRKPGRKAAPVIVETRRRDGAMNKRQIRATEILHVCVPPPLAGPGDCIFSHLLPDM